MTFIGFAQRTRMRSALGKPHPSEKPVVDESLDSSSAMLSYEDVPERDWRDVRVRCEVPQANVFVCGRERRERRGCG
jgi:hypothetical protein